MNRQTPEASRIFLMIRTCFFAIFIGISLMKSGYQIRRQIGKKLAFGPRKSSGREKEKTLGVHFLNFVDTKRFFDLVSCWYGKRKKIKSWEAGIRTPIGGSRVRSLTVRRPPRRLGHIMNRADVCQAIDLMRAAPQESLTEISFDTPGSSIVTP
jgi:hypothetical protein